MPENYIEVINKIDKVNTSDRNIETSSNKIYLSAKTGEGIDSFKNIINKYLIKYWKKFINILDI